MIGPRTVQYGADYNVLLTFKRDDKPTKVTISLETADEINEQIHSISPSMTEGEVKTLTLPVIKSFSNIKIFFHENDFICSFDQGRKHKTTIL